MVGILQEVKWGYLTFDSFPFQLKWTQIHLTFFDSGGPAALHF